MIKENVVDNWGEALKNIAIKEKMVDRFLVESSEIITLLKTQENFVKLLSIRNLEFEKTKLNIIDEVFGGHGVNKYFVNTMKILVEEKIFYYLRAILKNMRKKITSLQNVIYGIAWSTIPLTLTQLKSMESKLTVSLKKKVRLVNKIDPELIGGVKLVVADHVLDGTVRGKLDQLRHQTMRRKEV